MGEFGLILIGVAVGCWITWAAGEIERRGESRRADCSRRGALSETRQPKKGNQLVYVRHDGKRAPGWVYGNPRGLRVDLVFEDEAEELIGCAYQGDVAYDVAGRRPHSWHWPGDA